ncbi:MAG: CRISPR-associated protein Cas4 [Anaerolineales bacterium]
MGLLILTLLLGGVYLLWRGARRQQQSGLPQGRVVYADTSAWGAVSAPLYDPVTNLTGRPDYIVQQGEMSIPVEVKSARVKDAPYDGHVYQLAAYCLLIERNLGVRPAYGILHYANRTFEIPYTPALEQSLRALVREIHTAGRRRNLKRSHTQPARCRRCGYRDDCDQKLV